EQANRAATSLAAQLCAAGVSPGDRVVLASPKTIESHLTIHALLDLGASVVPVDPRSPASHVADIVRASQASTVVASAKVLQKLDRVAPSPRCVAAPEFGSDDAELTIDTAGETTAHRLPHRARPSDEAYIIFTSGSTGVPKGIVHTHRSARAYADAAVVAHSLGDGDTIAGIAPLHFDMSTLELYAAPLAMCCIAPVPDKVLRFPASVIDHSRRHGCTVWYLVPTLLRALLDQGALSAADVPSLRLIAYAGEPCPPSTVARLMQILPDVDIQNAYGPAETNVVSVLDLAPEHARLDAIPIGEPWPGALFDIRDVQTMQTTNTSVGELWLSADTMMDGYLARPDLTRDRTQTDDAGRVWYRTGDLVRTTEHGVVFEGRVDNQVKIRGVRLELDAIESTLESFPGVATVVVAPHPADSPTELLAAVGCSAPVQLSDLRKHATSLLTPPAIPTSWMITGSADMPKTSSGKTDRKKIRADLAAMRNETKRT
ncbi:MAG: AMP-binding protein, partial [Acidimicrobiales bacterium]|nr:AMP-binding protein [Acidimicrobiales bacterium]